MSNDTDKYFTIKAPSEGVYKEKGSKFLAYAYAVYSEDEVKEKLDELASQHHKARHICYAYRLGATGEKYRINDDGEPSGTAGKPIYGQLLSFNVNNILVAVVRYFGGTKLGVGGLITAYKEAAKDALQNAEIVEKTEQVTIHFWFDYSKMGEVMHFLKHNQLDYQTDFSEQPHITLWLNKSEKERWVNQLKQIDGIKFNE